MRVKEINDKDYEKAYANTHLCDNMAFKEEFKGCLFVYDDGFEEYVNSLQSMDELDQWLYTRWYYNKDG